MPTTSRASAPRPVAVTIPFSWDADLIGQAQDVASSGVVHQAARTSEPFICLVTPRKEENKGKGLVLPKGGIEAGETGLQAAVRELWEEAGLTPSNDLYAGTSVGEPIFVNDTLDHKPHRDSPSKDPNSPLFISRAMYTAFEIPVDASGVHDDWPERDVRSRVWLPISEAADKIAWRRDIHQLLLKSQIGQTYLIGGK